MEEERLPEVLRSPQIGAACADPVSGLGRLIGLADQAGCETRPALVPAIPVTRGDLLGDGQALPDIGHPRIGLADTALQLAVERDVIKIEFHRLPHEAASTLQQHDRATPTLHDRLYPGQGQRKQITGQRPISWAGT